MKNRLLRLYTWLVPILLLTSCVTGTDGKKHLSPGAKAALQTAGADALVILENTAAGAASGALASVGAQSLNGQMDGNAIEAAAISGGFSGLGAGIRTLEGTAQTPTAAQISTTIAASTGSPALSAAVAPALTGAIEKAIQSGAPVDAALETAAKVADAQAAKVEEAAKGP